MEFQELIIIGSIVISTIVQIIAYANGDTKKAKRLEEKRQKQIAKLTEKHKQTEKKYIDEEMQLKELNENVTKKN